MDFSIASIFDFSLWEWITAAALLFFFLVQLFFYAALYKKPLAYEQKRDKTTPEEEEFPSVSVIIASKNESEDLEKNLPAVLEQDYPNFEVIVINSGSTDETDVLLKHFDQSYKHLYHTFIPAEAEDVNVKKLALTLGIKAAKSDILLFTEAYCKPSSDQWIKEYAREFAKGRDIVLGYCKLVIPKKTMMRGFMRYDNLVHSLKYLAAAIAGKPFMGIGRNLAYRKELFFGQKGFSSILNIEGGEDDLFINKIVRRKSTGVVVSPQSMTETDIVTRFSVWRQLKSKYMYTKQFYRGFGAHIFGWDTFSKYAFYLLFVAAIMVGILTSNYVLTAFSVILFAVRYGVQFSVINQSARLFDAGKYHINLLFFDIFQPFNNLRFKKYANKRNRYRV